MCAHRSPLTYVFVRLPCIATATSQAHRPRLISQRAAFLCSCPLCMTLIQTHVGRCLKNAPGPPGRRAIPRRTQSGARQWKRRRSPPAERGQTARTVSLGSGSQGSKAP
jgi:hypothetical protein